uniref:Cyclin-dependent kinase-like 2 n=1 Tax=Callorhinchus milii TaxID=7868 RepID=V9KJA9_CALMI
MEKYENLGLVGEGSYGMVMKCRNKDNGRIVAIKKFLESDDDKMVKKIAMREIRLLKQLRHENLVNLLEVCRKKKRWYLVFEFVDNTVLDDLEQFPNGLGYNKVRKYLFQVLQGMGFCHSHNIIHRDIKPENILVSQSGVVKLCDFGFARTLAAPGEVYTDYVATRWYRAPELLVGDTKYGKAVDMWAIGCLVMEMLTGEPLFPGDSDIDQLYHIMKCFGSLTPRLQELFYKNPLFAGLHLPDIRAIELLQNRYPKLSPLVLDLVKKCLQIDPDKRPACTELLHDNYFTIDGFSKRFSQDARNQRGLRENLTMSKKSNIGKRNKDYPSGEEHKSFSSKESSSDVKTKEIKSDTKLLKTKPSKVEAGQMDRALNDMNERAADSGALQGFGPSKLVSPALLRELSSSINHTSSPPSNGIPPIPQNPPPVTTAGIRVSLSPGVAVSTQPSFRVNNKLKKHINPLKKANQPPPSNSHSMSLNGPVSQGLSTRRAASQQYCSVQHEKLERATLMERVGITGKKRWELFKSEKEEVHLLANSSHLPELRGAEAKHSKPKKENKRIPESRIPSLAAMDIPHQHSLASQVRVYMKYASPTLVNCYCTCWGEKGNNTDESGNRKRAKLHH